MTHDSWFILHFLPFFQQILNTFPCAQGAGRLLLDARPAEAGGPTAGAVELQLEDGVVIHQEPDTWRSSAFFQRRCRNSWGVPAVIRRF